ncbi:MAG: ribonuclease HII [Deltaproteobacteria bacterium]|nr:ribonuclease HII [Deltaproteobacteria bacterium]
MARRNPPACSLFLDEGDPVLALSRALGGRPVAGLDEAGRGPLAGPVVAAACVLPEPLPAALDGLDDSKKLSEAEREALYPRILEHARAWGVASVEAPRIDEINVLRAALEAMAHAFAQCEQRLGVPIVAAAIDGNQAAPLPRRVMQQTIVQGDAKSRAIMAASIIAKVTRDRRMLIEHARHPAYGFDQHKGYPTPQHLEVLGRVGPCAVHRRSFAPVRAALVGREVRGG